LRMVSSYLSLLERRYGDRLDKDGMEFLFFARDGARRMDRLVLDLLDFSRIERKGAPMVAMPILPTIGLAIRTLAPAIAEAGARIQVEETLPLPLVVGDADQIARLFQNLIGNALKYRSPHRQPEIHIAFKRVGDGWEFRLDDNGIGIEEQYFERIFRLFQRLHTRDKYDGTGIGLAICKKIVERHGGFIWVSSVLDEGSSFHFTLPAAADA
jgi:light-regulated signal transduction histidine kinase (bacteriophytochrome)